MIIDLITLKSIIMKNELNYDVEDFIEIFALLKDVITDIYAFAPTCL